MGLDNIVYERKGVQNKELAEAMQNLTGGFLTDDANSFRGKVYADLNEAICGYSLYDSDEWDSNTLTAIVNDYEQLLEDGVNEWLSRYNKTDNVWDKEYTEKEVKSLYKIFKLCRDNYWQIIAWY